MQEKIRRILATPPSHLNTAKTHQLPIGHMAYRVGNGPHLMRANLPLSTRGGYMVVDDKDFDGRGEPSVFCQEIMRECNSRGYSGVICDFTQLSPLLGRAVAALCPSFHKRGWSVYVPEAYAAYSEATKLMIPTALSGGSLRLRMEEAIAHYGARRIVMAVDRSTMDFLLPSPTNQGQELTQEQLQERIAQRSPTIFFSGELCAHYFTYMTHQSGAHFILFDDATSIQKKLDIGLQLGIREAIFSYPEVADLARELFGSNH